MCRKQTAVRSVAVANTHVRAYQSIYDEQGECLCLKLYVADNRVAPRNRIIARLRHVLTLSRKNAKITARRSLTVLRKTLYVWDQTMSNGFDSIVSLPRNSPNAAETGTKYKSIAMQTASALM